MEILPIVRHMTAKRIERFWSRVSVRGPDECWPWLGRCMDSGYGVMSFGVTGTRDTVNLLVHRIAKTLALGRDLAGPLLRHTCNHEPCCNPAHLSEGTHRDNYDDSVVAGTAVLGVAPSVCLRVYGSSHPAARFTETERLRAIELWENQPIQRITYAEIARRIGCHKSTIARWLYDAFPDSFLMPASVRRMRTSPQHAEAVARAKGRTTSRWDCQQKIRERTAELVASGVLRPSSRSC